MTEWARLRGWPGPGCRAELERRLIRHRAGWLAMLVMACIYLNLRPDRSGSNTNDQNQPCRTHECVLISAHPSENESKGNDDEGLSDRGSDPGLFASRP
jgi:hypothetical protein